jgi:hypothetical protein
MMSPYRKGYLSDYFEGYAAKRLTRVEVDPNSSNQHEFQGVQKLRQILGTSNEKETFQSRFIWLDEDKSETLDSYVTWSDVRRDNPNRSPEYHLYYSSASGSIVHKASPGDLLLVCKRKTDELLIVITPRGGTIESQLSWLFDFQLEDNSKAYVRNIEENTQEINVAASFILDELGIETVVADENFLDLLIEKFDSNFPTTAQFSAFARETSKITPEDDPDEALITWLNQEEKLFKTFEKYIVGERLKEGFYINGIANVDQFISFSLSVQNRRKSRAGFALENHLEPILQARRIRYKRGAITEHNIKPDFLFPGFDEYHDPYYPSDKLSILGTKSTCKDRWRQVLSEAARIKGKHLLTLEPSISENQTNEMRATNLQLVVPKSLHLSYTANQQRWLYTLLDFIKFIQAIQNNNSDN